jgi:hypothetical protein
VKSDWYTFPVTCSAVVVPRTIHPRKPMLITPPCSWKISVILFGATRTHSHTTAGDNDLDGRPNRLRSVPWLGQLTFRRSRHAHRRDEIPASVALVLRQADPRLHPSLHQRPRTPRNLLGSESEDEATSWTLVGGGEALPMTTDQMPIATSWPITPSCLPVAPSGAFRSLCPAVRRSSRGIQEDQCRY